MKHKMKENNFKDKKTTQLFKIKFHFFPQATFELASQLVTVRHNTLLLPKKLVHIQQKCVMQKAVSDMLILQPYIAMVSGLFRCCRAGTISTPIQRLSGVPSDTRMFPAHAVTRSTDVV
jgi:hypothetical protein